ncbi:MAG TPA: TonB-dependent receptor [Vicinamibacterales bacterium]|nr:TonB-dependent receptor [Vicinamibacterales bacterium]
MFLRRTAFARLALLLFTMLASVIPASAQLTTGTLTGTLKDAQGGVVPGATVTLTSEGKGTQLSPAFTNANGDFVIANVQPDTYTIEVTMAGFKPIKRSGISISAGDRVGIGTLIIELGGLTESVTVQAESPLVQTQSGERSFTVATKSVENLPIANRSFVSLASLAPGVTGTSRVGDRSSTGGGNSNVMMDGISTMDTGSNSVLLQMNVESIAEVKVLVSNYQAEYGRSSGIQISAVTKSGTNRFRGSAYDVMRKDSWNENSRTNILNGDPKTKLNEKDLGYSIGGPIGKPGGNNKLFFFYAHEYAPRTAGGDTVRFRFPTLAERAGDFSASTDNNGAAFPFIKDPLSTAACSATNQAGCFQSGGVVGRIPADRLYNTGLNILKLYPQPNVSEPGASYNYVLVRPEEKLRSNQPAIRLDYQPSQKLRGTFKYSGWAQQDMTIPGTIPGWNDTKQYNPFVRTIATTVNYSLTNAMFLEGTWGRAQNSLTGCALAQANTGPSFCRSAFPMNEHASLAGSGLTGLPFIFPDAGVVNPDYFAYEALNGVNPPIWDGKRISMVPNLAWGSRIANAPTNVPFPGYLNVNKTNDLAISLTNIRGRHTLKAGFYNTHSYKAQQRQGWQGTLTFSNDAANPLDTGFGFANAAVGVFSSFNQFSQYVEGNFVYNNTEGYVQDNWKVTDRWTLDYGVRFVHQQPQYDELGQAANFLPEKWSGASAPQLYQAGCLAASPCSGTNRQARDPRTGALLGPTSAVAIGTLVPSSGNTTNGLFLSGDGIAKTTYTWPAFNAAPRFGTAYDLTGHQNIILRGGAGLFYDRPAGNSIFAQVQNPPTIRNLTLRYSTLQSLTSGLQTEAAPTLTVYQYKSGLPSTWQWNGGVQLVLPWAIALDVEYAGQHAYNLVENVNINAVDFGAAYAPTNQDATITSPLPGGTAVVSDQLRAFRGFSSITQAQARGWLDSHSLQMSFNRRFRNGVSFGFNDAWLLSQKGSTGARLQHNADGTFSERADQAQADELLGNFIPVTHTLKGNFVWDLPDLHGSGATVKAIGYVLNDWQVSGVWTGSTGAAYTVSNSYQSGGNVNVTGSPDYGGRIRIVGDTGSGCNGGDPLRQFNASGFAAPGVNSNGLESGADYLRGCFQSVMDMALARNIRLGANRQLQFRLDAFNAFNSAIITGRNTTLSVASPIDGTTANLPYDANGNTVVSRSLPKNAGFGVANAYQAPRTLQAQIRFSF